MSLEKIEILVKKIDLAIKTIHNLKEENSILNIQLENYKKEIEELSIENKQLKNENSSLLTEKEKTNDIYMKLENKIEEVLKYLPDEEFSEVNAIDIKTEEEIVTDNIEINSGKELKSEIIEKTEKKDKLKPVDKKQTKENLKENIISDSDITEENKETEETEEDIPELFKNDLKFEEMLIDEKENEEVDFYINKSKNNDLPKGVL